MPNENSLFILVCEGPGKDWIKKDAGPITRWWKSPGVKDKTKRWLKETSPTRWVAEQASPDYSTHMNTLREVDDQIKAWSDDLSSALDRAEESKKVGKPLDAIFWLGQINTRLKLISGKKKELEELEGDYLEKYFGEYDQPVSEENYFSGGENKLVQAGLLDYVGRRITTRKFEQAHKKRLQEARLALIKLLNLAKVAVGRTQSMLKEMSSARGSGDISRYIQLLEKVGEQQSKFETEFRAIYDRQFAQMVAKIKQRQMEEKERSGKITEEANQREKERMQQSGLIPTEPSQVAEPAPFSDMPTHRIPRADLPPLAGIDWDPPQESIPIPLVQKQITGPSLAPASKGLISEPPESSEPATTSQPAPSSRRSLIEDLSTPSSQELPSPATLESEWEKRMKAKKPPETVRSQAKTDMEKMIIKMNHAKFYKELEKSAAKNDPYLLAAMMLKYSEMIDEDDPQKSLELLSIAEGILNG